LKRNIAAVFFLKPYNFEEHAQDHPGAPAISLSRVRGTGLGVFVEYAGKSGVATYAEPTGPRWDYRLFGQNREAARG